MYAWGQAGVSLPHSSSAMFAMTQRISVDQLQPGDLVFGGSPVHHVGLYVGNGLMVHAPHTGDVVRVASIYGTSSPVRFGRL
jgi:cell wall-associated NlpC family hydrolase